MLLEGKNTCMQVGDLIILYVTPTDLDPLILSQEGVFQNRLGHFPHTSFHGKPFGSKILSQNGKAFVWALRARTDLWTRVLPHRTQILYQPDIGFIIQKLRIGSGSVVVESGTGSASFTHNLAKVVAPRGHVHTFEFHEQRAHKVKQEIQTHKLEHLVTCTHRDVCLDGFKVERDMLADAVFLDLPAPWDAIPQATKVMKPCARICCFSPCIEQVSRTIDALKEHSFKDISLFTCNLQEMEVKRDSMVDWPEEPNKRVRLEEGSVLAMSVPRTTHTSFLTFARK